MALSSVGSTLTYLVSATATPLVGELTAISFSGVSCAEVDTSNLSSSVKSFVLGTLDGGTVTATCNFTAAPDAPVAGDKVVSAFTVTLGASGVVVTFSGYVSGFTIETGIDAVITVTYTIQVTGAVTIA